MDPTISKRAERPPQTDARITLPIAASDQALWSDELSDKNFNLVRKIAFDTAGIAIADFKKCMVLRRIRPRIKALALSSIDEYCDLLRSRESNDELQPLINALTTNKTSFFREDDHFDHLSAVALPQQVRTAQSRKPIRLRFWSAGCSSGEEAWSIAMVLDDVVNRSANFDAKILATDIDTGVLQQARIARYRTRDIETVPARYKRHFIRNGRREVDRVEIADSLRTYVAFRHLNLQHSWPFRGQFDAIFCRNVAIYFNHATQARLFNRMADALIPGGFLYCGHSERPRTQNGQLRLVGRGIYQRVQ